MELLLLLEVGLVFLVGFAVSASDGGACNSEQAEKCLGAVQSRKLSSLQSGGECQAKAYVEFSHICSVSNYLPASVDHCCCGYEDVVLCCTYHQNWKHFRCAEAKDVVGKNVPAVPLHIIIPAVLVGVLIIAVIIVCCVKRQCGKQDDDQESQSSCLGTKKSSSEAVNPSSSQSEMTEAKNSVTPLLTQDSRVSMDPSAPPEDDVLGRQDSCSDHAAYFRLNSETPSVAGGQSIGACPQCSSVPPTYEESRDHQVLP